MIAPLGEPRERVLPEDVDAATDPAIDRPALREAGDVVVLELDDPER